MKIKGFTLIEAVLVIAILIILAAVAVPRFAAVNSARVNAASRTIAADIRYAQSLAISTRKIHGFVFDSSNNQYYLYRETHDNIIRKLVADEEFIIKLSENYPNVIIDTDYKDYFDYSGAPNSGGTFSISNNGSSPVRKISILTNTGRVLIK